MRKRGQSLAFGSGGGGGFQPIAHSCMLVGGAACLSLEALRQLQVTSLMLRVPVSSWSCFVRLGAVLLSLSFHRLGSRWSLDIHLSQQSKGMASPMNPWPWVVYQAASRGR